MPVVEVKGKENGDPDISRDEKVLAAVASELFFKSDKSEGKGVLHVTTK